MSDKDLANAHPDVLRQLWSRGLVPRSTLHRVFSLRELELPSTPYGTATRMAAYAPPRGWLVKVDGVGWVRVERSSGSHVEGRRLDGGGSWSGDMDEVREVRDHLPTGRSTVI